MSPEPNFKVSPFKKKFEVLSGMLIVIAALALVPAVYLSNQHLDSRVALFFTIFSIALIIGASLLRRTILRALQEENAKLRADLSASRDHIEQLNVSIKTGATERQRTEEALQRTSRDLKQTQAEATALAGALDQASILCPVTGLTNRRHFETALDIEWRRMMRDKKPLSLIMLGFDREDRNLPPSEVSLKHLAGILKASIHRGGDLAIRYDHTKFGLLLIGTDTRDASRIAEALRRQIAASKIAYSEFRPEVFITVHAGVTTMIPSPNAAPQDFIKRADTALYEARFQGGNKVVGYRSLDPIQIESWNEEIEGLLTGEKLLQKLTALGFDATLKIHAPKTKIPDHSPESETVHAVLSGKLRLTIDGQPLSLKPGDCLFLPHGTTCSTELIGDEPVYMFEAVKVSSSA
ncbi:MAG TPA: diguanylate cyclase [Gammaproteobacteria bacterium]|nr:diguanylate cyclase [Gammaproteobacteria bacterium]